MSLLSQRAKLKLLWPLSINIVVIIMCAMSLLSQLAKLKLLWPFQQHVKHTEHLQAHKAGIGKVSQLLYCLMMTSIHLVKRFIAESAALAPSVTDGLMLGVTRSSC